MSLAIIDAREWQNVFDLKTSSLSDETNPCVDMMKKILAAHPYPGDTDESCSRWVTDTAMDLIRQYRPELAWIMYAYPFFTCRHTPMTPEERKEMFRKAADEIDRFAGESGFEPVIIGTGGLVPLKGFIDISLLDGLVVTTQSLHFAGIHNPSEEDIKRLSSDPDIVRFMPKQEFLDLYPELTCDNARMADYIMEAAPGMGFKSTGGFQRKICEINDTAYEIPVHLPEGTVSDITEIKGYVLERLKTGKTAIIIAEGFGFDEFPWSCCRVKNGRGWLFYEPGDAQYMSISGGSHRVFDYPLGYRHIDEVMTSTEYPLSGYFNEMPRDMIGETFQGRSIAAGNRSMYIHTIPQADVSIECFARNLYNQGTLGVVHRSGK